MGASSSSPRSSTTNVTRTTAASSNSGAASASPRRAAAQSNNQRSAAAATNNANALPKKTTQKPAPVTLTAEETEHIAAKDFSFLVGMPEARATGIMNQLDVDDKISAMNTLFSSLNKKVATGMARIAGGAARAGL